jgi:ribosomal protein L35
MAKTNKALLKRIKITRRGKVLIRKGGKIHFRAKQRRAKQMNQKKWREFKISKKQLKQLLPYI